MPTLSTKLFLIIRIGSIIAAVWSHIKYFRACNDLFIIPSELTGPSLDPQYCRKGEKHSHLVYYARNQFEPQVASQRILYNLGNEACPVLLNHTSENNAYQTIGHKTVLILRNKILQSTLIGKVHHKLNTRSEDQPEWAAKIVRCLQAIHDGGKTENKECSIEYAMCEINQLQAFCQCSHATNLLLSEPRPVNRYRIVNGALHPTLFFHKFLQDQQKDSDKSIQTDSWPFAHYLGGCGMFAVSKYVGCPLSDFFYEDISTRIKIVLKVLDVAIHLDKVTETKHGGIMLYNRDFHLENLALGTDGRVYITDTDEVSILGKTPDSMDENEWKCNAGMMQNIYDVLVHILSDELAQEEKQGDIFEGFLNGLHKTKESLKLQEHPKIPYQADWIQLSPLQRVIHLNEVIDSLNETLFALSGCNSYLRWILTILCVLVWLPKLYRDKRQFTWRSRTFRQPISY